MIETLYWNPLEIWRIIMIDYIKKLFSTKQKVNTPKVSQLLIEMVTDIKDNPSRIKPFGWEGVHKYNTFLFKDNVSNFKFMVTVLPNVKKDKTCTGEYEYRFHCSKLDVRDFEQDYIRDHLGIILEGYIKRVNDGVLYNTKEDRVLSAWRGDSL